MVIVQEVQVQPAPPKDPFPFYGLMRRLHARVVDANHRSYAKAKPGSVMTAIEVKGEFGRPESLMTLTFYKAARSAGRHGKQTLHSIARFKPFVVKRGRQVMTLRVPAQFKPDHIGVIVQEVVDRGGTRGSSAAATTTKVPVGEPTGAIVAISDAARLHARKPAKRRPKA